VRILRRWLYLIIGGALLMPFIVLVTVLLGSNRSLMEGVVNADLLYFAAALPLAAVAGFFPLARTIEVPMARAMLGDRAQAVDPAGRGDRGRVALYWLAHVGLGGVVSAMTLAIPPAAVIMVLMPFAADLGWRQHPPWVDALGGFAPVAGIALLAGLVLAAVGAGEALARLAPTLLGPSAHDRIATLRRTAEQLAERNRLARELHDSVGHTLSVVILQASAASAVLDTDLEFARKALSHIEETAREAQSELDDVLGMLRETPRLRHILGRSGLQVDAAVAGDETRIPPQVAHELHQILREGLTNIIRHAGQVPARLRLDIRDAELEMTLSNPLGRGSSRVAGGRGLQGIRERVSVLRGELAFGVPDEEWVLKVKLPLGGPS